jgi:hypothetical protein
VAALIIPAKKLIEAVPFAVSLERAGDGRGFSLLVLPLPSYERARPLRFYLRPNTPHCCLARRGTAGRHLNLFSGIG